MSIRILRRIPHLIVLLILTAACFVLGNAVTGRSTVEAQVLAGDGAAPERMGTCKIISLGAYADRIELECQLDSGGIEDPVVLFVAPLDSAADSRQANRYLSLLTTAYALSRSPVVYWENMIGTNLPLCPATSCRRLSGVVLQ